jgi:hypothetical protein
VSWWCPCCRHHHDTACCSALARVSPCKHCGEGHSYRSCSLRREQALRTVEANARAVKAQLAASQLSASSSIVFGNFDAVPIQPYVAQSASEVSEVAKVERTTGLRSPAKRTVAPQSPGFCHEKSVKRGRRRPDARAYRDDLFRKSQPPLYALLRSLWEASHMARWTDLFPAWSTARATCTTGAGRVSELPY